MKKTMTILLCALCAFALACDQPFIENTVTPTEPTPPPVEPPPAPDLCTIPTTVQSSLTPVGCADVCSADFAYTGDTAGTFPRWEFPGGNPSETEAPSGVVSWDLPTAVPVTHTATLTVCCDAERTRCTVRPLSVTFSGSDQ